MKVKEFLEPFTFRSVFMFHGELHSAYEIANVYGDFKVVKVDASPNLMYTELIIDEPTCDCYEVTKEMRYLTEYEKGCYYGRHNEDIRYVTEEVPRCLGTKERETCTCEGYKSRCNFYREKFMKELENDKNN